MPELYQIPQEVEQEPLDELEAAILTAVYNSMLLIREHQRSAGFAEHGSQIKADGSLLTETDLTSEQLAQQIFADLAPGIAFTSEEGSKTFGQRGKKRVGYDPVDGTRALAVGAPTPTVIGTVYNPDNSVHGAMIGEPSTGRIFSAFGDDATHGRLIDLDSGITLRHAHDVTTWQGELSDRGQVFIDNNRPHRHDGHATLYGDQHDQLRQLLRSNNIATMEFGSNGAHQLYVASGADRAAGAITTARGNPEDTAAGAFLVDRSGGAVQRLDVVEGIVTPVDTENSTYDMLIVGNNQRTLDVLRDFVLSVSL